LALKRQLQVSVRDLVEYTLRSGDLVLDFSFSGGQARAIDGIRAHQKIQAARPKEYQPEVTVSFQAETHDFTVFISGRIDGVYRYTDPDRAIIDEIKTTTRDPDLFEEEHPIHWGQAKVYAYLYAFQKKLKTIDVQLTYFQMGVDPEANADVDIDVNEGKTREFRKSFTLEELEVLFNDLLARYLGWLAVLETWRQQRDDSIRRLEFPYSAYRPGQQQMMTNISQTIEKGEQLMVEAPTGIGKTVAAIFPVIKAIVNRQMKKFFYLTAKTTGRTVAQNTLEDLRERGLQLKSLTLTAKEKICFSPGSSCNGEECEFARGYFDRINEAVETVFQGDTHGITREVIEESARRFTVCPFEFSLELSLWVDGIICDYNYAFDPRVYLRRFFGEESRTGGGGDFVFLVDEANNLVDRSREMFSAELYKQPFLELRRMLKKDSPEISRNLGAVNNQLVKLRQECDEASRPLAQESYPVELIPPLRRFIRAAERWLAKKIKTPYRLDLVALYFEVSWFLKVADNYSEAYATCLEIINSDFRVKLFCMDPSHQLTDAFLRCTSVIFFSATLSPMDYFRHILGCDSSARELILRSPFPQKNLCLPVADRVSTLYKYRERTKTTIARIISELVNRQPGNYLIFFPSYQYMKMIFNLFILMNSHVEYIVQTPGMSEAQRDEFLENFIADNRAKGKTLVGFAVMGGIFGEAIDLKGDRLTGAAVVGVGLPGISLERELIKEYFSQLQGTGFEYAYLYPGMNRVFQAAGRVIRTADDRGVVLLIGHRFTTQRYSSLLPSHWHPIRIRDEQHLKEVLDQFWKY
jgi:DNA excision repair protein ERCC-2